MWVVALAPLAFIFMFSFRMDKMSASSARMTFFAFAAVMGASLSTLLIRYTGASVVQVFFITAASFGALSLWGYTTSRSLSGMGSFLIMGVVGLIIASIVNIFVASSMLQFGISVLGVLIFAGLTAYDTQKLKEMYLYGNYDTRGRRQGVGVRRADALPGLHQHVPVPAGAVRQPQPVRSAEHGSFPRSPGCHLPGPFFLTSVASVDGLALRATHEHSGAPVP